MSYQIPEKWLIERVAGGARQIIQEHRTAEDAERALRALRIHFPDREYVIHHISARQTHGVG